MYKDLFNYKKRMIYKYLCYVVSFFMVLSFILTLIYWEGIRSETSVFLIIITVGLIGVWFYFVSWLSNSDRYIRLKLYIDSKLSDNILSTLFQEYINQTDWKFLKSLGNKTVCVYANTNNKDRAEYWIHLTFWKNQFIFEINEREIKYLYGPSKIEEQDIDDWIHLKKEDFASLSAKEILVKIHLLKETFVKEKNNK